MALTVRSCALFPFVSGVALLVAGCGMPAVTDSAGTPAPLSVINGKVHGGQQPVTGASVQLYAASASALAGASTPLLSQPATTDSLGNFTLTGKYTCPTSNPLIYVVATGGNPGLGGSATNGGIAMMSMLGSCNTLVANAASTFIFINELSTIESVQVLAPFMTDYLHVGSAPSSISGVGGAFDSAASSFDFSTGQFNSGLSGSLSLDIVSASTVSDILASCINTASGSQPCSSLYSLTGGTSDTIAAALQIVKSPGQNVSQLYALITANPPFQPYFNTVPSDFTSTVGYALPPFYQTGTLDSNGRIWLYFGGYNYDTATDTSTDSPGYIAVYDNNFNQIITIGPGTGGLFYPHGMGRDASGHVFAINANNSISEFDSNGAAVSPPAGWPTGLSTTFSPTTTGNAYATNPRQGELSAVDAQGNIWGYGPSNTPGTCYFEMNSSGTVITPTGNFCTITGNTTISTSDVDGLGSAWVDGTGSIAKVNAQGALAATAPVSQGCFYTYLNAFTNPNATYQDVTLNLQYDHVNNQLWGYSVTGIGAITDSGAQVFCDYGSATLPVGPYTAPTGAPGTTLSTAYQFTDSGTLDGAGNFWFVVSGTTEKGVFGSASNTFAGTATFAQYLAEVSPSGALLTPYNAATGNFGLQPTGLGANATVNVTNAVVGSSFPSAALLGVDRFGNIWAADVLTNKILKITGLAAANTVNY